MRHPSKSLSFSLPLLLTYFWKGLFRTHLIFRTWLEWFGVSSLHLLGPCFSSAPEDSIICINHTVFLLYSLYTHKPLLLPEEIFWFCNLIQISSNLKNVWYLPCSSLFPWLLFAVSFLLLSPIFILLPNELMTSPDKTGFCICDYCQLFHLKVYVSRTVFRF